MVSNVCRLFETLKRLYLHVKILDCDSWFSNSSKSIDVYILTVSENDKGRYIWPETIAGHKVELPCNIRSDSETSSTVTNTCSNNGTWVDLNTSKCPYTSEITRILQQFSKVGDS